MDNFCFYIDESFFDEGISIDIIREFKVLFEVSRQLKAETFYNKTFFDKAISNLKKETTKPKFKEEVKKFVSDFIPVNEYVFNDNKINIILSKNSDYGINKLNDAKQAWSLIIEHLPKRLFNKNYPKHGRKRSDNNCLIEAQKGESQLYTTDDESQELLNNAIFDLRKRANFHVNFDNSNDLYILFPNENTPQNTFHAFHLNNNLWNEKIPISILKFFNKS
jgi:hypothetical protein